ncbi:MAG: YraN family protein [Pseudomonadota bacterium]
MWFSRKKPEGSAAKAVPPTGQITTKQRGDAAEAAACRYLAAQGLTLIETNFRTPGRGGGEIDLVMRAPDRTLVFVEVRQRSGQGHGGAGASIGAVKQRRIVLAARHYLIRLPSPPPCRFDVVLVTGAAEARHIEWLQAAFDAS